MLPEIWCFLESGCIFGLTFAAVSWPIFELISKGGGWMLYFPCLFGLGGFHDSHHQRTDINSHQLTLTFDFYKHKRLRTGTTCIPWLLQTLSWMIMLIVFFFLRNNWSKSSRNIVSLRYISPSRRRNRVFLTNTLGLYLNHIKWFWMDSILACPAAPERFRNKLISIHGFSTA